IFLRKIFANVSSPSHLYLNRNLSVSREEIRDSSTSFTPKHRRGKRRGLQSRTERPTVLIPPHQLRLNGLASPPRASTPSAHSRVCLLRRWRSVPPRAILRSLPRLSRTNWR